MSTKEKRDHKNKLGLTQTIVRFRCIIPDFAFGGKLDVL